MSAQVIKFYPKNASDNPDNVLEQAVGDYTDVLILGWDKNGFMDARSSTGMTKLGDLLHLIEMFKHNLLSGVYNDD